MQDFNTTNHDADRPVRESLYGTGYEGRPVDFDKPGGYDPHACADPDPNYWETLAAEQRALAIANPERAGWHLAQAEQCERNERIEAAEARRMRSGCRSGW